MRETTVGCNSVQVQPLPKSGKSPHVRRGSPRFTPQNNTMYCSCHRRRQKGMERERSLFNKEWEGETEGAGQHAII